MNARIHVALIVNVVLAIGALVYLATAAVGEKKIADAVVFRMAEAARTHVREQWAFDEDLPDPSAAWRTWREEPVVLTLPRQEWHGLLAEADHLHVRLDNACNEAMRTRAILAVFAGLCLFVTGIPLVRHMKRRQTNA